MSSYLDFDELLIKKDNKLMERKGSYILFGGTWRNITVNQKIHNVHRDL